MHRSQGQNRPANTIGPAQGDHGFQGVGQSREPFKIREQIKLEVLDSAEEEGSALEKQSIMMASNSIFESFSSYQPCFTRGQSLDGGALPNGTSSTPSVIGPI